MRTVIIPSAGKATRFGGTLKELLPINPTDTPMLRAIQNAVLGMNADELMIITNAAKVQDHMNYVMQHAMYNLPISYRMQTFGKDLWGAIQSGFNWNQPTDGGLVLPDTITFVPELGEVTAPITFGTFWTQEPERFSVLIEGTIRTKEIAKEQDVLERLAGYKAWGTVLWNAEVANYWMNEAPEYDHYDDAFRDAMQRFGYSTFELPYYYDVGTFSKYVEYLKGNTL